MAKFVEHCPDIIGGEESRLARGRHGEISNVTDDRQGSKQLGLAHKAVHPGAALLVITLEVVAVKQRQRLAISIKNFEDAYARRIHRKIFSFFECQSVKLVRSVENTVLQHVIQLEIGLDLLLVEIVFGFANLLG